MKIEAIKRRLAKAAPGVAIGPVEIDLGYIRVDPTFQVRARLNDANLASLRAAYKSGAEVEPITLALISDGDGTFVVIDGHHRVTVLETLDAEARLRGGERFNVVKASIARLSSEEARFRAADANARHGLQLDRAGKRKLFVRYIEAGHHLDAAGGEKSYRVIGKELMTTHNTISKWMSSDFPAIAEAMSDPEMVKVGGAGAPRPVGLLRHSAQSKLLELAGLFEAGLSGDRGDIIEGMKSLLADFERTHARTSGFENDDDKGLGHTVDNGPIAGF